VSNERLADALARLLASVTGDTTIKVDGLRRLSGGASRETWSFDAVHDDGSVDELILRRDPPGRPGTGMIREALAIEAAGAQGVPVPQVMVADDDADRLGSAFIVMQRVAGETIPRRILRDEAYAATRPRLAAQCGEILAAIHRVPLFGGPGFESRDALTDYRDALDRLGQAHPAFELGLRWLSEHRPAPGPTTLVHGDFRNGNLIVGPDGIRAVLDWELVHLGDPLEDLGWLCVRAWRFGVDRPVGGFGDYGELIDAYESASGRTVDRDALRWWEALGTLKWGIACITQTTAHTTGLVRSVELAAIGRRVCENEWDLLNLLPAPWSGR
jgi:aminoglycoside phosphotransferase (APT) family kinase protein